MTLESAPTDGVISKQMASGKHGALSPLSCAISNPTATPTAENPNTTEGSGQTYIGFYMGAFPLAWMNKATTPKPVFPNGAYIAAVNGGVGGSTEDIYITYRMQYQDWNGTWRTYDTKYGAPLGAGNNALYWTASTATATIGQALSNTPYIRDDYVTVATDPRTARFGLFTHYAAGGSASTSPYNYGTGTVTAASGGFLAPEAEPATTSETGWMDTTNNTMGSFRMDATAGSWLHGPFLPMGTTYGQTAGWNLPWGSGGNSAFFYPGLLEAKLHPTRARRRALPG